MRFVQEKTPSPACKLAKTQFASLTLVSLTLASLTLVSQRTRRTQELQIRYLVAQIDRYLSILWLASLSLVCILTLEAQMYPPPL